MRQDCLRGSIKFQSILVVFLSMFILFFVKIDLSNAEADIMNLRAESTIPGRVDLSWEGDSLKKLIYYYIYRSNNSGFTPGDENLINIVTGNRYFDWGLTEGMMYYYRVMVKDKEGHCPLSKL